MNVNGPNPEKQPGFFWNPVVLDGSDKNSLRFESAIGLASDFPKTKKYTKSFMHRDQLLFVDFSDVNQFLITCSVDGQLKFWKKVNDGIEFVKTFRVSLGEVCERSLSSDEEYYAIVSRGETLGTCSMKIFDVLLFDMVQLIKLSFQVLDVCFIYQNTDSQKKIALSDKDSSKIYIYDIAQNIDSAVYIIEDLFRNPVNCIAFNSKFSTAIGIDTSGMIEYWSTLDINKKANCSFSLKSETDLYIFKKLKKIPTSITISPDFSRFAVFSDNFITVFDYHTGKIICRYDESIENVSAQVLEYEQHGIDRVDLGKRLAVEKAFQSHPNFKRFLRIIFDKTSQFLIYPSFAGIKLVNIDSNKCVRIYGHEDSLKFICLAIYQTAINHLFTNLVGKKTPDPTIFASAFKTNRFYLFTSHSFEEAQNDRDVINEAAKMEEKKGAKNKSSSVVAEKAILRTTLGDIMLDLFAEITPKTVENFCTLAKKGMYNGCLFHRVIQDFMIQTGDYDGLGGKSIWNRHFEDEISTLRHDKPFVLSMANAGPNTNASQFFITTVATPWLDGKHTIFGKVSNGFDIVKKIEQIDVDFNNQPISSIRILNIDLIES